MADRRGLDVALPRAVRRPVHPVLLVISRVAAAAAVVFGALIVLGWAADVPALYRVDAGFASAPLAGGALLIVFGATWLLPAGVPVVVRRALTLIVLATGIVGLVSSLTGIAVGHATFVTSGHDGGSHPSVIISVCLILLAIARLAPAPAATDWLAAVVVTLCALPLLGYLYDVSTLYDLHPFASVPLVTALGVMALGVATLTSVPDGVVAWIVGGRDAGSALLRRLLPAALVGLPLIGLGCQLARRAGWLANGTSIAVLVIACALLVVVLSWAAAHNLTGVDERRVAAMGELTYLKQDLERQVTERAGQLERRRNQVALLEDRQRIAADLHDIVIQRLFAAGMFLQGAQAGETAADVRARVATAIESMDMAIKDLRSSIFELTGQTRQRTDVTTAVDEVCAEYGRILGFVPDVVVDDPDWAAEDFRDDVLAVLREALSNVARHAEATSARVELRCDAALLSLAVVDDGRGMPPRSDRRSGTRNLADRASQRGGDCRWEPVAPRGTRMVWTVPLVAPALEA